MKRNPDGDPQELLAHILLFVAGKKDAVATATVLESYCPSHATILHVVEKGEEVPDITPVTQSRKIARESYTTVRTVFSDVDEYTAYARDIVDAIPEAAEEADVSAIAHRFRGGSRLVQSFSEYIFRNISTNANHSLIALSCRDTSK